MSEGPDAESDAWDRGDRSSRYYHRSLERSRENPLAQHSDASVDHVVHPEEMPWEDSPQGRLKHLMNSEIASDLDVPANGTDVYIQEIPPGSQSGKHRHMSEELVFVLDGAGYDLHWDPKLVVPESNGEAHWEWPAEPTRFDWETEDVVYIPTNTAHRHVNESDSETARLLCCQARVYDQLGYGFSDLEQFDEAPEYDG
jgi:quercetin dioxygenase-like cupin family protein